MKKEEILEMSRKENKKKDIYEIEIETKGCKIAALSMLILATFYFCYEIIAGLGTNNTLYSLIAIYCSVEYGYKALKLEKNRKLNTLTAVIWGLVTLTIILEYFNII